jgi:lipoyl-dependent peroxiredoxin
MLPAVMPQYLAMPPLMRGSRWSVKNAGESGGKCLASCAWYIDGQLQLSHMPNEPKTGDTPMAAHTIKPLVTAVATSSGGRNGHAETTDHSVHVKLSVRKEMGGPGLPNTTTPEHLFAAGYAACFGGALEFVASQHKKDVNGAVVTCETAVGPREGGGFGIAVKMHVKVPTLSAAEANALVKETHDSVCPYSHATRGNVDVHITVDGKPA